MTYAAGPFLPPDTPMVLSEHGVMGTQDDERLRAIMAFLSDPEKARRCAETQLIETPDFQSADEPAVRTKTRGASGPVVRGCILRQDDTSDEAYEQLHSKFERAEKRLRRLEKDGLVRDRRRMVEQVARLEAMDMHKLLPALEAREAELSSARRPREAILACAQQMHAELLAEARETLARYNKLLPDDALADTRKRPSSHTAEPTGRGERRHARARRAEHRDAVAARSRPPLAAQAGPAPSPGARKAALSTSAFGECLPDYVAHRAAFDDTMAQWIEAAASERRP